MWYPTYGMRKTTLYLRDDEAAELRRVAAQTGRSQADLLREALRHVLSVETTRAFHSMGKGRGTGAPYQPWEADDLYRETMGQS